MTALLIQLLFVASQPQAWGPMSSPSETPNDSAKSLEARGKGPRLPRDNNLSRDEIFDFEGGDRRQGNPTGAARKEMCPASSVPLQPNTDWIAP